MQLECKCRKNAKGETKKIHIKCNRKRSHLFLLFIFRLYILPVKVQVSGGIVIYIINCKLLRKIAFSALLLLIILFMSVFLLLIKIYRKLSYVFTFAN